MNLEVKVWLIRWLSSQYGHYADYVWYAKQSLNVAREAEHTETPLEPNLKVAALVGNRWDEILSQYRHANRVASVPISVRHKLMRENRNLFKDPS